MKFIIAMTLPVFLFIVQLIFCFEINISRLIPIYELFLISYLLGICFGSNVTINYYYDNHATRKFYVASRIFIFVKFILIVYFSLIFISYISSNGYDYIRGYMLGDGVSTSRYYSRILMYIDAYIIYPLNFIFLATYIFLNQRKKAVVLSLLILIQYAVFYSSRMVLYYFIMFFLFYFIYIRFNIIKLFAMTAPVVIATAALSTYMVFFRDNTFIYGGIRSIKYVLYYTVFNYHLVPPIILNSIIEKSEYFKDSIGYGRATFGFLIDPIIALLFSNPKSYMVSKILSSEAQNYVLFLDGKKYNAFTTFLYPALYDFGIYGPCIYGLLFGFLLSYSYNRRDCIGGVFYVVIAYYVYFDSFTFYITGEWFFVLILAPFAFRRYFIKRNYREIYSYLR